MNCDIFATPEFGKSLKRLAKRYLSIRDDYESLLKELRRNPTMGTDLGRGLRKIRMAITSKGKGKSGGARVITLVTRIDVDSSEIILVAIYDKSECDNISDGELSSILRRNGL